MPNQNLFKLREETLTHQQGCALYTPTVIADRFQVTALFYRPILILVHQLNIGSGKTPGEMLNKFDQPSCSILQKGGIVRSYLHTALRSKPRTIRLPEDFHASEACVLCGRSCKADSTTKAPWGLSVPLIGFG
jgi:hypothetical protein